MDTKDKFRRFFPKDTLVGYSSPQKTDFLGKVSIDFYSEDSDGKEHSLELSANLDGKVDLKFDDNEIGFGLEDFNFIVNEICNDYIRYDRIIEMYQGDFVRTIEDNKFNFSVEKDENGQILKIKEKEIKDNDNTTTYEHYTQNMPTVIAQAKYLADTGKLLKRHDIGTLEMIGECIEVEIKFEDKFSETELYLKKNKIPYKSSLETKKMLIPNVYYSEVINYFNEKKITRHSKRNGVCKIRGNAIYSKLSSCIDNAVDDINKTNQKYVPALIRCKNISKTTDSSHALIIVVDIEKYKEIKKFNKENPKQIKKLNKEILALRNSSFAVTSKLENVNNTNNTTISEFKSELNELSESYSVIGSKTQFDSKCAFNAQSAAQVVAQKQNTISKIRENKPFSDFEDKEFIESYFNYYENAYDVIPQPIFEKIRKHLPDRKEFVEQKERENEEKAIRQQKIKMLSCFKKK